VFALLDALSRAFAGFNQIDQALQQIAQYSVTTFLVTLASLAAIVRQRCLVA
jgi:hypothetical protein